MTAPNAAAATSERYRRAGESKDVDPAMSTFAPDAVLRSPLTERIRFTGHAELRPLLEVAYRHLENLRLHTDVGGERTRAVVYPARVRGVKLEEATLLRFDDQALIAEARR